MKSTPFKTVIALVEAWSQDKLSDFAHVQRADSFYISADPSHIWNGPPNSALLAIRVRPKGVRIKTADTPLYHGQWSWRNLSGVKYDDHGPKWGSRCPNHEPPILPEEALAHREGHNAWVEQRHAAEVGSKGHQFASMENQKRRHIIEVMLSGSHKIVTSEAGAPFSLCLRTHAGSFGPAARVVLSPWNHLTPCFEVENLNDDVLVRTSNSDGDPHQIEPQFIRKLVLDSATALLNRKLKTCSRGAGKPRNEDTISSMHEYWRVEAHKLWRLGIHFDPQLKKQRDLMVAKHRMLSN